MKNLLIKSTLLIAFLLLATLYYAKRGQDGPVIYNQVQSAEDNNVEMLIEQERDRVDTTIIETIQEVSI